MSKRKAPSREMWVAIPTKLQSPRPPVDAIERPRLLAQLDEAAERRLLLVSAPAGYGKTSLAAQWLARRDGGVAWLSLDSGDDDLGTFCRNLVAAIERVRPGALPRTRELTLALTQPPASHFSKVLSGELASIETPLVVCLDDFQQLRSPPTQEIVRELLEGLPPGVQLLLLCRSDPALPLARWRGRGWLAEMRARDLRFSLEECRTYFAGVAGLDPAAEDVGRLCEAVEGWPAGLQLARISMARAEDPGALARNFTASDRLVADYLIEEVLAAQPPEIRRFLAATASFDRFCPALCDRLLPGERGSPSGGELLREARRRELFLIALDNEERWFRYHHLFAQLLRLHLPEAAEAESRRAIARRAAAWFEEEGLVEEAVRCWIAAGDLDAAANRLWRHLDTILDQYDALRLLRQLLALFPAGAEVGRLALLVAHGHESWMRWDLERIRAMLEQAESHLASPAPAGAPDLRADIEGFRCFIAFWQGEGEEAIRYGSRALAVAGVASRRWVHSLATIYRAGGLYLAGRAAEAHRSLEYATLDEDARDGPHFGRYLVIPGFLHLYANELEAAALAAQRVVAASRTLPIAGYWLGEAEYLLGSVALERDRLEEAETWFRSVLERKYHVLTRFIHDSLLGLALVAERRGDLAERDARTVAARDWALEANDGASLLLSDSFESRGRRHGPEELARESILSRLVNAQSPFLEVPSITACERLLLDSDPQVRRTALPAIEALIARFEAGHNERQALRLAVLRADALADAGRRDEALKLLAELLRRAEREGSVRPFLGGGRRRRELLAALASRGPQRGLLERILSPPAAPDAGNLAAAPVAASAIDPLTAREQQVLDLLVDRLANKEIAAQLGVSSETVKKRLLGIYSKLGVHGRREAVAAALARGLIGRRPR